ncbi:MAG: response regulator [Desulfovibrionaceae bacterium]|nr:response regulator [Desulfovibrionaceae bacterium]MDD4952610.1 response regulator [Desulfovibrionaceae bacterium]
MRVLLVDDEAEFLEILTKRLKKRNLDVSQASSGREAIAAVREGSFDVVVLDMKMPDMDGIEVLREIKSLRPGVEVLILTGHANMEAAVEGMELGAFDYMLKPATINELIFKLEDAYKKKQARDNRG